MANGGIIGPVNDPTSLPNIATFTSSNPSFTFNPATTAEESITGKPGVVWKQTSMNKNFRGNFASTGGSYDPIKNIFINKKPFSSWILQEDGTWQSPIGPTPANPIVGNAPEYSQWWDEENQRFLRYRILDSNPRTNYIWNTSNSQWEEINLDG
jgi:hypothetical protein